MRVSSDQFGKFFDRQMNQKKMHPLIWSAFY